MQDITIYDNKRTLFEQVMQVLLSVVPHERNHANQLQQLQGMDNFAR
jgi:hypothetical protein